MMRRLAQELEYRRLRVSLSHGVQVALVLALVGFVMWMVLFSDYPKTHDFFHNFRHSLGIVACH
jgi:cell division septal protein FtsQ